MKRSRHPNKHVDVAVAEALEMGWRLELSNGHAWGHLLCPHCTRDGCIVSVWSTPKNPEGQAKRIRRALDKCPHS